MRQALGMRAGVVAVLLASPLQVALGQAVLGGSVTGPSDRTRETLQRTAAGIHFQDIELTSKVAGPATSVVVLTAFVRDGKPQRTGRQEVAINDRTASKAVINGVFPGKPSRIVTLGKVPLADMVPRDRRVQGHQVMVSDTFLRSDAFVPATAIPSPAGSKTALPASAVRDWNAASVAAATPRGLDWTRFDALYIVTIPLAPHQEAKPLVILVPRQ